MGRVPHRLRQRPAHLQRRADHAIQPRVLDHADDGRHAPPLFAQPLRQRAMIFDLGRGVGAVAHLLLQPHDAEARIARPVRQPARQDEAGQPARRIGQRQKGVAHRRRAEPLMPGQGIQAVPADRLGAGGVGAHVRAALLLGHGHAHGHARLLARRAHRPVIAAGQHAFDPRLAHRRIGLKRCDRGVGHGHGATGPRIRLSGQKQDSRVQQMPIRRPVPGAGGQPRPQPQIHQLVIGRMKRHLVDPAAIAVVGVQHRRDAIGLHAPVDHLGRSAATAQIAQPLDMPASAPMAHRVMQSPVAREEVDVLQRRNLIGHLMGVEPLDGTKGGHGRAS